MSKKMPRALIQHWGSRWESTMVADYFTLVWGRGGVIKECGSGERQMLELTNIMVDRFAITFDKAIASTVRYE